MATRRSVMAVLAVVGLGLAACTEAKDGGNAGGTTAAPVTTAAPGTTAAPETTATGGETTMAPETTAGPTTLPPPSGEPFVVGVVNTEGAPGLDFPDFTNAFKAAAEYANTELGGFGGRPVELEICISQGSPESSQACAQDLAAQGVALAVIGLDVFVDYATFSAAGIPVIGAVPILPPDYTADAVYITAGNLVVQGSTANAITNPKYLGLKSVAVIANDAAATVSALASLEPALAKGGASVVVVKGGETETDAGYRSLMQQAAESNPEAIISLYGQAGCVALMRARVELGVTAPVFSNTACLADRVIEAVGDDAVGWYFAGSTGGVETDDTKTMRKYVAAVTGGTPEEVDPFGFTSLGWLEMLTVQRVAAGIGPDATGPAIIDVFRSRKALQWGSDAALECGSVASLPAVCSFAIPFAEYTADGAAAAFGGDNISALDVLDV